VTRTVISPDGGVAFTGKLFANPVVDAAAIPHADSCRNSRLVLSLDTADPPWHQIEPVSIGPTSQISHVADHNHVASFPNLKQKLK
jgi:hypothetical protein